MAAVESLEDEALKRRERLKALRKKSGLPDQEVDQVFKILSPSPFMWNIVFCGPYLSQSFSLRSWGQLHKSEVWECGKLIQFFMA